MNKKTTTKKKYQTFQCHKNNSKANVNQLHGTIPTELGLLSDLTELWDNFSGVSFLIKFLVYCKMAVCQSTWRNTAYRIGSVASIEKIVIEYDLNICLGCCKCFIYLFFLVYVHLNDKGRSVETCWKERCHQNWQNYSN